MKLKTLFFLGCFSFCSIGFAQDPHSHPKAEKGMTTPSYCEIEIDNYSFSNVRVYGMFDDGSPLQPFSIYSFELPHYISLYYYGYCHAGMDLHIETYSGYILYSGFTFRGSTIRILPFATNKPKVEISTTTKDTN